MLRTYALHLVHAIIFIPFKETTPSHMPRCPQTPENATNAECPGRHYQMRFATISYLATPW
jgi:hypothetical protein